MQCVGHARLPFPICSAHRHTDVYKSLVHTQEAAQRNQSVFGGKVATVADRFCGVWFSGFWNTKTRTGYVAAFGRPQTPPQTEHLHASPSAATPVNVQLAPWLHRLVDGETLGLVLRQRGVFFTFLAFLAFWAFFPFFPFFAQLRLSRSGRLTFTFFYVGLFVYAFAPNTSVWPLAGKRHLRNLRESFAATCHQNHRS